MADDDLHLANTTIRESGPDEVHLASSVGVLRFATVTEEENDNQDLTLLGVS